MEKGEPESVDHEEHVNEADLGHWATNINGDAAALSPEHREYLMRRHGTLELDPMPGHGNADPYNWTSRKKTINLLLVAFHAMMSTFTAASIIPAFVQLAARFDCTIGKASYLASLQIAVLGGAPFFWRPLSNRFGRRPIWLISTIGSLVCNIGCAKSPTYGSMAACRALVAFFISPAAALGSAVVSETFFKHERARYMGIWTVMVTLGVPLGSFIFGFVIYHIGYTWVYWILAMINGGQFILYIFFGPETRYLRRGVEHEGSDFKQEYMTFKRIDPTPFSLWEFVAPLGMVRYISVVIPAASYAMIFLFGSVLTTVEIPQLFAQKFGFNAQQLGLQFIGIIIGSLIGEQLGGVLSDRWMRRRGNKLARSGLSTGVQPEYRLWLSYIGFVLTIIGLVVFLVQTEDATTWNVTPIVGAAIAAGGNQIVTTVLITYAVDCHHAEAASVGVFVTFVRQMWGFIGPFWFPDMFTDIGLAGSAGVGAALIIGVSIFPIMFLQWRGEAIRDKRKE